MEIKLPGFRSEPSEPVHDLDPTHSSGHGRVRVREVHKLHGSCKGNLAVLRKSLKLARDDPKRIYKNNIYKQGLDTTDLARDDPKRIL